MQEKLLIYTGLTAEKVDWLVVDQQGQALQQSQGVLGQDLAEVAKDKSVVLLLSASDVLLCSVEMPKMSRARLKQAVPYALEERLLDEPEHLHFALGARQPDDTIPVAIVNKSAFANLLGRFKQIGVQPDSVIPVILTLPVEENCWTAIVNQQVLLRSGDYQGFDCEKENFDAFLSVALAETHSAPEKLMVFSPIKEGWQLPVEVIHHSIDTSQWLRVLAPQIDSNISINLLQGDFSNRSRSMPALGKLSKINFYLLALLFFVVLLYPLGSYIILQKRVDSLNAAIEVIYKKHYPKSRKMVSPKKRMQALLDRAKNPSGDNQLFLLLSYVAKDMSSAIHLKQFNYQNNILKLQLTAASSAALEQFTQALLNQGLKVQQQNVNVVDNGVTATLELR